MGKKKEKGKIISIIVRLKNKLNQKNPPPLQAYRAEIPQSEIPRVTDITDTEFPVPEILRAQLH